MGNDKQEVKVSPHLFFQSMKWFWRVTDWTTLFSSTPFLRLKSYPAFPQTLVKKISIYFILFAFYCWQFCKWYFVKKKRDDDAQILNRRVIKTNKTTFFVCMLSMLIPFMTIAYLPKHFTRFYTATRVFHTGHYTFSRLLRQARISGSNQNGLLTVKQLPIMTDSGEMLNVTPTDLKI